MCSTYYMLQVKVYMKHIVNFRSLQIEERKKEKRPLYVSPISKF